MFVFLIFKLALSFGLPIIDDIYDENTGSSNSPKNDMNVSVPIDKNTNIGNNCACDTSDQCELYCCCDEDCPKSLREEWEKKNNDGKNKCLSNYSNIKTSEYKALRKCSDPQIEGDGSLLDWIQRTMLCIYKDNFLNNDDKNKKHGKYYEIKTKSSEEYIDDQSSLVKSFQVKIKNENEDAGFPSTFSFDNIFELDSQDPLDNTLNGYCLRTNGDKKTYRFYNESNYTDYRECPGSRHREGNFCVSPYNPGDKLDFPVCDPNGYEDRNNKCISFYEKTYENYTAQEIPRSSIDFLENLEFQVNCSSEGKWVEGVSEDMKSGIHYRKVTFSNISCKSDKCTANFNVTNLDKLDDGENNIYLNVSFIWQKNEDAENVPRGYFFTDPILDKVGNPITIDAPAQGYFCSSEDGRIPLKFGMNTDFTCMMNLSISDCNITEINESEQDFNTSSCNLSIIPENISFLQVPYPYNNEASYIDDVNLIGDFKEVFNASSILQASGWAENQNPLFLTGVTRSIDIFYKTVGYEHNPTHILVNMSARYDYSTSIKYLNTDFVDQYRYVTLRTIIKYYEYPNSLNMFRGSSTNTKLQSWLPFDV